MENIHHGEFIFTSHGPLVTEFVLHVALMPVRRPRGGEFSKSAGPSRVSSHTAEVKCAQRAVMGQCIC